MKSVLVAALLGGFLLSGCSLREAVDAAKEYSLEKNPAAYCSFALSKWRAFQAYDAVAEVSETDHIRATNNYDTARRDCAARGIII